MRADAAVVRIGHDPVSWAHPSWLAHYDVSPALPRRFQNRLLCNHASLAGPTLPDIGLWPPELLSHWSIVSRVAYLCGVRLARGSLLLDNRLSTLENGAETFITLPMPDLEERHFQAPVTATVESVRAMVFQEGLYCIYAGFPELPRSLRSRLRLCLPADTGRFTMPAIKPVQAQACLRLFRSAIHFCHAKNA